MRQYIADAFTDRLFSGNPAAVCIMDEWISDEQMLSIAKENNLSDTAFAVKEGDGYRLRWFTPEAEIDLCGHATLAAGFIIMNYYEPDLSEVRFHTMKDILTVKKTEETSETNAAEGEEKAPGNPTAEKDGKKTENVIYEMDFPAYSLKPAEVTPDITEAVGAEPLEVYIGRDLLCVFSDEEIVRNLQSDPEKLKKLDGLLLHATAKGGNTTAYPEALHRSSAQRRILCAVPGTVISYHTGRKNQEKTGSSLIRRQSGAARCTAAWKAAV